MAVPARHAGSTAPVRRRSPAPAPRSGRGATPRPSPRPRRGRRTRSRPNAGRVPFLLLSLLVVGGMVMALVSLQAVVTQRSFQVQELERRADELASDYGRLRLELAELSSPGRIELAARRAGLVPQDRVEILEVPREAAAPPRQALASTGPPAGLKAALGAEG